MSIRHLDSLFDPASVALIGASPRPMTVGNTVWRNLRGAGFAGPCWAVNPKYTEIEGEPCFADVASLPAAPELAIVATPASSVAAIIAALGARGTRAAVVLSAGFNAAQKQALLDAARPHLLRILGPNGLGLLSPHAALNASFAHVNATPGALAFVSQSGALSTAMLDWARARQIGFSHCVSLGEHADIDFADMLDWLASDARTRAILLYIESIEQPRKFMSAARAAARNKPVLVVKAGRSAQGAAAAASHTGALAASDLVFDAAIRRAGMLRVQTLDELFLAAETLSRLRARSLIQRDPALDRLTVLTNGGGAGVLAADAAELAGVELAPLTASTRAALDAVLPAHWSHANPVDIIGDAPIERYVSALQALLADPQAGTVLFIHAPTAIVPSADIATALAPLAQAAGARVLGCWLGDAAVREARDTFRRADVASFDTAEQAVRAFSMMCNYRHNQALLMQAPPSPRTAWGSGASGAPGAPGAAESAAQANAGTLAAAPNPAVRKLVDQVLAEGRSWLTEPEAKALLAACAVPVVATRQVPAEPAAAVAAAQELGFPVVLKILSPDINHKSDVGGVALNLEDAGMVQDAAAAMLRRVAQLRPSAMLSGFSVQTMVRRPQARELIVGASIDPLFGPVLLFGQGGKSVEVVADRAVALPPLNAPLAQALIQRTRVAKLLGAWRDVPAVDEAALVEVLINLSQLLADEPRIAELDINPLLADEQGVLALDARVRVSAAAPAGAAHFAIRPYPQELVEQRDWQGRRLTLRPIRPEDEAQHMRFLEQLDPVDIRMRVFYSRRSIERSELARLTQIDYEREMAFIATVLSAQGEEETLGVARAACDPDNQNAEFGIVVRSDLKGLGLGEMLMAKLIAHLRQRGTQRLVATVLRENTRMLDLARDLGFGFDERQPDGDVYAIHLALAAPPSDRAAAR
jgi:acetyltransferase